MNDFVLGNIIFRLKEAQHMMKLAYLNGSIPINRYWHGVFVALTTVLKYADIDVEFEIESKMRKRGSVAEFYMIIKKYSIDGKEWEL